MFFHRTLFSGALMVCVSVAFMSESRAQDEVEFEMDEPDGFEMDEPSSPPAEGAREAVAAFIGKFKFGMTRDQVMRVLEKEIQARYLKLIRGTMDVYQQDVYRRQQAEEIERVKKTMVGFDGKPGGWDASIVDDQFAHGTGESMLVSWEVEQGRSQRRFFFFFQGKLYKVFLALDMSGMDEKVRDFDIYKRGLRGRFGQGHEGYGRVSWTIGDYRVEAIDKLTFYNSFCLAISDVKVLPKLVAKRKKDAVKPGRRTSNLKFLIEDEDSEGPDLSESSGVVDRVLGD